MGYQVALTDKPAFSNPGHRADMKAQNPALFFMSRGVLCAIVPWLPFSENLQKGVLPDLTMF